MKTMLCLISFFAGFTALAHQPSADDLRAAAIKAEIKQIALSNLNRTDNRVAIRQALDAKISELSAITQMPQGDVFAQLNVGSWRQIWADESNPDIPGFPQDLSQVYQTITPYGYGFNFGLRNGPQGAVLFILKVKADLAGPNVVRAEITKSMSRSYALKADEDLMSLSYQVENKSAQDITERNAGTFPNGPIGAVSDLTILFLDQDLKIGVAPNAYTGFKELFVMEREARPVLK